MKGKRREEIPRPKLNKRGIVQNMLAVNLQRLIIF